MSRASNTVYVLRGTEGNETIVRVFHASEDLKAPLTAAKHFLRNIADNKMNALHEALLSGELSYVGGHPVRVLSVTQPTIVGL